MQRIFFSISKKRKFVWRGSVQVQGGDKESTIESLKRKVAELESELHICNNSDTPEAGSSKTLSDSSSQGSGGLFLDMMNNFRELAETQLQCAVCSEVLVEATAVSCGHTFCRHCITVWKAKSATCPVCRADIRHMAPCKMMDEYTDKLYEQFISDGGQAARQSLKDERLRLRQEEEAAAGGTGGAVLEDDENTEDEESLRSWPDLDQNTDGGWSEDEDEDSRSEDDDEHNEEDIEDRDSFLSDVRSPPPQEQSPGGSSSSSDSSGFIPPPRTRYGNEEQPVVVPSTSNNPPTVPTSGPETTNTPLAHFPGHSRVHAAHMMDPGAGVQQQPQPWTGAQPSNVQNIVPRNGQGHGAASTGGGGQLQMSGPGVMVESGSLIEIL